MLFTPASASTPSSRVNATASGDMMGMAPLFGSPSPSSSCNSNGTQDRLIIQRPTSSCDVIYSFDWSDFPVFEDHYVPPSPSASTPSQQQQQQQESTISWPTIVAPPAAASATTTYQYNFFDDSKKQHDVDHQHHHLFEVSLSDSDLSSQEEDTESRSATSATSGTKRRRRQRNSSVVSFSDQIHVRTHSIVLGDHPCCPNLPLELGWEYEDSTVPDDDQENTCFSSSTSTPKSSSSSSSSSSRQEESCSFTSRGSSSSSPRLTRRRVSRRSYLERKALLKQVAGLSEEDIEELTSNHRNNFPNQRQLPSSAPSVSKSLCELERSWADL